MIALASMSAWDIANGDGGSVALAQKTSSAHPAGAVRATSWGCWMNGAGV